MGRLSIEELEERLNDKRVIFELHLEKFREEFNREPRYGFGSSLMMIVDLNGERVIDVNYEEKRDLEMQAKKREVDSMENLIAFELRRKKVHEILFDNHISAEEVIEFFGIEYDEEEDDKLTWDGRWSEYDIFDQ